MVRARVTSGLIDPGTYPAILDSVESKTSQQYGEFWAWNLLVGEIEISGASTPKLGPNTKARRWTEALIGRPLELDEEVDYDTLEGRPCLVAIETNDNGYSKVAEILPPLRTATRVTSGGQPAANDDDLPF